MKASELFIKCLENEGVEKIFGVPGEENAHFMMALENSSIEFVLTRHEQGAAFMADVYGRLTGKAGVCLGTLGPGATNLVTGVADANMDRAPLIVITGQADMKRLHKESHQNMDVVGLFHPVTKWARSIVHPDNIPEVVRKAFKIAQMEKPGACHIELPEDIANQTVTKQSPLSFEKMRRPAPDEKALNSAVQLISKAKRPVILAGNGCVRKRSSQELNELVSDTGIFVISTFMGKGAVPMDSPHCLYTIGLQSKDLVACAIDAADLVIAIGYDLVEYHPRLWNPDGSKNIIHIDFEPAEIDENYHAEVEIVGDVASSIEKINEKLKKLNLKFNIDQHASIRNQMTEDFEVHKDDETKDSIRPQKVLWDVRQVLKRDDILLSDVGAHKMWIARYYHCLEPNTCLISNGFCSMGFALPGAIGAKLVYPDRNVLAICGDGGFLMNVQEMETANRLGTHIVVMVWEDNEYGLIAWKQDNEFGRHTELKFQNPNFKLLAQSFGWQSYQVNESKNLASTLDEAFNCGKSALVVLPIDYRENNLLTKRLGDIACPI